MGVVSTLSLSLSLLLLFRKLRIVQYARHTRQLLIQLLALVKWAQTSNPIRHCTVRQYIN